MGKKFCLWLSMAGFVIPVCLSGQTVLQPSASVWQYAAGVAGFKGDAFGAIRHPAMPSGGGRMSLGLSAESVSGLSGMTMISAVAGFRLGQGVAGGSLDHRSMSGSGETRLTFGYALPLSASLRAGLRLGFQGLRIPAHRVVTAMGAGISSSTDVGRPVCSPSGRADPGSGDSPESVRLPGDDHL